MKNSLRRITERLNGNKTSAVDYIQRWAFVNLLNGLPLPKNSRALSVSTGDGCWDFLAFDKEPRIVSIDATDIVPNPVNTDDRALLNNKGLWKFTQVEKETTLPFKDEEFDLVYHHDVLEHVQKPFLFINEQYRTLKNGGWLVLSTPNLFRPANVVKLLLGRLTFPNKIGYIEGIGDYIHTKEYSADDITMLLEEAGFVEIKIQRLYFGLPLLNINLISYPSSKITRSLCHYLSVVAHKS